MPKVHEDRYKIADCAFSENSIFPTTSLKAINKAYEVNMVVGNKYAYQYPSGLPLAREIDEVMAIVNTTAATPRM